MTDAIDYAWAILKAGPPKPGLWQQAKDNWGDFKSNFNSTGGFRANNQRVKDRQAARQATRQADWDASDEGQAAAAKAAEQQQQQAFKDWKSMPENDPKWNEFQQWQAQQGQTPTTQQPTTQQPTTQPQQQTIIQQAPPQNDASGMAQTANDNMNQAGENLDIFSYGGNGA